MIDELLLIILIGRIFIVILANYCAEEFYNCIKYIWIYHKLNQFVIRMRG